MDWSKSGFGNLRGGSVRQQAVAEAMYGPDASMHRSIEASTRRYAGIRAGAYRTMFPVEAENLRKQIMTQSPKGAPGKMTWAEMFARNPDQTDKISKLFSQSFARGGDKLFSPSTGKRLAAGMGKVAGNVGLEAGRAAWAVGDTATRAIMNTPLKHAVIGTAAIAGLAYMAGSAAGVTRGDTRSAAKAANSFVKDMYRPTYGSSEMGQSTSGLVQGLNNRRTR